MIRVRWWVHMLAATLATLVVVPWPANGDGVTPVTKRDCPSDHPIKGNFTTYSGERCIYHVPSGEFYEKTSPERCYRTEREAQTDGCRRSKR